jgi:hypothetical protein
MKKNFEQWYSDLDHQATWREQPAVGLYDRAGSGLTGGV